MVLEALTQHLIDKAVVSREPVLPPESWSMVKKHLRAAIEALGLPQTKAAELKNGLDKVNNESNTTKLMKPFKALGIDLAPAEKDAISRRNTYLHRGRVLDAEALEGSTDEWHIAEGIERRLFGSIARLLLKYIGYEGPILAWGSTPDPNQYPETQFLSRWQAS